MTELFGYYFEDKFYKSLDDLKGFTMNEENKPIALYTEKSWYEKKLKEQRAYFLLLSEMGAGIGLVSDVEKSNIKNMIEKYEEYKL